MIGSSRNDHQSTFRGKQLPHPLRTLACMGNTTRTCLRHNPRLDRSKPVSLIGAGAARLGIPLLERLTVTSQPGGRDRPRLTSMLALNPYW